MDSKQLVRDTEIFRIAEMLRAMGEAEYIINVFQKYGDRTVGEMELHEDLNISEMDPIVLVRNAIDRRDREILKLIAERKRFKQDLEFWDNYLPDDVRERVREEERTQGGGCGHAELFARNPNGYPRILAVVGEPGENSPGEREECLEYDIPLLVHSIKRVMEYARPVWEYKKARGLPIPNPDRERTMLDKRVKWVREMGLGIEPGFVRDVFTLYMKMNKEIQKVYRDQKSGSSRLYCPHCGKDVDSAK